MPQKQKNTWINEASTDLISTILKLKNLTEAQNFFRDLMTEPEIRDFAKRWKVAQMLEKKIPFLQIAKATGMSPNTIARINRWLKRGCGGYKAMVKR